MYFQMTARDSSRREDRLIFQAVLGIPDLQAGKGTHCAFPVVRLTELLLAVGKPQLECPLPFRAREYSFQNRASAHTGEPTSGAEHCCHFTHERGQEKGVKESDGCRS